MKKETYLWVVVCVWRGLPEGVELFSREALAKKREDELRKKISQEDEVSVFCVARPS